MLSALLATTLAASPVMLPPGPFGDSSPFALGKRHPAISILPGGTGAGYSSVDKTLSTATGEPVPTTRASVHTCTQPDGTIEDLGVNEPCVSGGALGARAAVTNLALHSENLEHASWNALGVTVSPDVSPPMSLLTESSTLEQHKVQQSLSVSAGAHTFAAYVRENGRRYVTLYPQGAAAGYAIFDLESGTVSDTGGADYTSSTIEAIGEGGMYRASVTLTVGSSGTLIPHVYLTTSPTTAAPTYTGDGTSGIYLGGLQLTATSTLQDYCPTEGTAATCEGEVTTVDASALDPDEGCACATITPSWTGAPPGNITRAYLWQAADTRLLYSFDSDFMFAFDGSTLGVAAGFVEGEPRRYCTRWSVAGTYLKIENVTDGVSNSRASFAGWATALGTLGLGSVPAGGLRADATLTEIVLDTDPEGCR